MLELVPDTNLKALVRAVFRDIPSEAIDAYFNMAVTRFLSDTQGLVHTINLVIQPNVSIYRLQKYIPAGLEVHSIHQVNACGRCLPVLPDCRSCISTPGFLYDGDLYLGLPGCCDDVSVEAILTASASICGEIPKFIADNQYAFQLLLESMILQVPANKWTDFRAAEVKRREYLRQVDVIKSKRYHRNTDIPHVMQDPRFI